MSKLIYKNTGLIFLIVFISFCHLRAETVTKNVSASYKITDDTRLEISNKFGDVIIKRWDKNEIDLKVKIEATSKSSSKAQKILDGILIAISDKISSG